MLDQEGIDPAFFGRFEQFVARLAAEGGEILYRTGIGGEDFQGAAGRDFAECLFGFENRQRAVEALGVKDLIGHCWSVSEFRAKPFGFK